MVDTRSGADDGKAMSEPPPTPPPGSAAWYAQVEEPVVDPEQPLIDPHHHFWLPEHGSPWGSYGLDDLWADTGSGHRVVRTVFIECHAHYRTAGPEHLRPVGETEWVAGIAKASAAGVAAGRAAVGGIVSFADLRLGAQLEGVLDAHEAAGAGLFRGIRHAGARHPAPEVAFRTPGTAPADLFRDPAFRDGVRLLGRRGYTYESWHYHTQLRDYRELALAAPDTTIILDHLGYPLGTGPFQGRREEVFPTWQRDLAALAACPNVYCKLGGLAQPDNGFALHTARRPPTSDELISLQGRYYRHAIDCFGPARCMFESNFPVDKVSISYRVLWNAFKKLVAEFSAAERHAMLYGTAARVYRL